MTSNRLAPLSFRMDDQASRQAYEELLELAIRCTSRILPRDQAFELAHDVAVEMLRRPQASQISEPVVYVAVVRRLRNAWRRAHRSAAREGAYLKMQSNSAPAWAKPGAGLEARELRERIEEAVARMPRGMRAVFLLVREEQLSYKDAAARLGISVGTVHTQLSRAGALLRECVKQYHADAPRSSPLREGSQGSTG